MYCFSGNFFIHLMHACVIYKYIILNCDFCTMKFLPENGIKTDSKKAQGSRKSQKILDLGCLFEAGSIFKKYLKSAQVSRHTLCQRIVR